VVAVLKVKALGGVKLWLHSFLTYALDEDDSLAKVTLSPGKESYRLGRRLSGLQSPQDILVKRGNSYTSWDSDHDSGGLPARQLVSISTTVSHFMFFMFK
jgi:hypothetical protein